MGIPWTSRSSNTDLNNGGILVISLARTAFNCSRPKLFSALTRWSTGSSIGRSSPGQVESMATTGVRLTFLSLIRH